MGNKSSGMSASKIVRELVLQRPCLLYCMAMGIVNFSELARKVKDDVERRLGRRTSDDAIKMALIRTADEVEKSWSMLEDKLRRLVGNSIITLQTDIAVITYDKDVSDKIIEALSRLANARFLQYTQGFQSSTVFISMEDLDEFLKHIDEDAEMVMRDQSAIIIKSPRDIIVTPGFIAYITTMLAWNGININQIISCHDETILIVDRKDALRTYNILEELILGQRRLLHLEHGARSP